MNIFLTIWLIGGLINFLLFLLGASFENIKNKVNNWQNFLAITTILLLSLTLSWIILISCMEFAIEEYKKSKESE